MAAYKILVDAMGGDYAPKAPVEGALIALERHSDLSIVMAGWEPEIRKALEGKSYDAGRLQILHKEQVVENDEFVDVDEDDSDNFDFLDDSDID